ncbi:MAG: response regulator [Vampirovibrio sp.]|nr:response regulator [Vampirovibrio sp.]
MVGTRVVNITNNETGYLNEKSNSIPLILHVDDEPLILKAAQRHFRNRPFQVLQAQGAMEALNLAKRFRFDMAVLDISMPRVDGFELMKMLRKQQFGLPVLMLTGLSCDEALYFSVAYGCDGFLEKPFDPQRLEHEIQSVLLKRRQLRREHTHLQPTGFIQIDAPQIIETLKI